MAKLINENVKVTSGEAANIIGVSRSQIRAMIYAGCFNTVTRLSEKPRSHYVIDLREVERAKRIYRRLRQEKLRSGRKTNYECAEATK